MTYMTNQEIIDQFYAITRPNGKNSSTRHKESFWRNNGHGDLWDIILERTSFLDESKINYLGERIVALENNLTEHPKCLTCGKPVMVADRKRFSEYCCKECIYKDPKLSEKRKNSAKKTDYQKANSNRKATMVAKYGVEYNSQRSEVKAILSQSKIKHSNPSALEKLESFDWLYEEYVGKQRNLVDIAKDLDVYYGTVGEYCRKHGFTIRQRTNYSQQEKEIGEYLNSLGIQYTTDREVLDGHEIDLYIEEKKMGIELDGIYWHSFNRFESKEEKQKHLAKTTKALEKGINLIHVLDTEWIEKQDIIKSMIISRVGLSNKIYARKCSIKEISPSEATEFLEKNHIQGSAGSALRIGLFYDDDLVMLISFGKPRFNKNYSWELIRLASKLGTTVVGGASKLFNYFINNNDIGEGVICYSDRRFGEGKVYENLGFILDKSTEPGYYWTDGYTIWSRTKFQKHKLHALLPNFNDSLSEAENMFINGYRRLWDCGVNVLKYT